MSEILPRVFGDAGEIGIKNDIRMFAQTFLRVSTYLSVLIAYILFLMFNFFG